MEVYPHFKHIYTYKYANILVFRGLAWTFRGLKWSYGSGFFSAHDLNRGLLSLLRQGIQ